MWKQPWKYIEGWTISAGIFITGTILQFITGKINPESFSFPVNIILGTGFLHFLLIFHLISIKIKPLQWFSGHVAAITSLTSLLILIIIMGLTLQLPATVDLSNKSLMFRSGFMQMTVSWQFLLLSFYLLSILGLVILKRLSRFKLKDAGFILNHAGLFILFFAALLSSGDLQRLRMTVPVSETEWRGVNNKNEIVELPLAIELNSFTIDEYPPKLMLMDNNTGTVLPNGKPQNILVEKFPSFGKLLDWELETVKYLPAAAAMITKDTVNFIAFHSEGATAAVYVKAQNINDGAQKEGWVSCGNFFFPQISIKLNEKVTLFMPDREPKCYVSDVTVYVKNGGTKEALIEVNKPLSLAGWKIYQLSYETERGKWSRYSVFELVKDSWLPLIYLGIVMLLAGSIFLIFSAPEIKN